MRLFWTHLSMRKLRAEAFFHREATIKPYGAVLCLGGDEWLLILRLMVFLQ